MMRHAYVKFGEQTAVMRVFPVAPALTNMMEGTMEGVTFIMTLRVSLRHRLEELDVSV